MAVVPALTLWAAAAPPWPRARGHGVPVPADVGARPRETTERHPAGPPDWMSPPPMRIVGIDAAADARLLISTVATTASRGALRGGQSCRRWRPRRSRRSHPDRTGRPSQRPYSQRLCRIQTRRGSCWRDARDSERRVDGARGAADVSRPARPGIGIAAAGLAPAATIRQGGKGGAVAAAAAVRQSGRVTGGIAQRPQGRRTSGFQQVIAMTVIRLTTQYEKMSPLQELILIFPCRVRQ